MSEKVTMSPRTTEVERDSFRIRTRQICCFAPIDCLRRVSPVPVCRDDGRLTQSTAGLQPEKRETSARARKRSRASNTENCFLYCPFSIAATALYFFRLTKLRRTFSVQVECLCFHTAWPLSRQSS